LLATGSSAIKNGEIPRFHGASKDRVAKLPVTANAAACAVGPPVGGGAIVTVGSLGALRSISPGSRTAILAIDPPPLTVATAFGAVRIILPPPKLTCGGAAGGGA